MSNTNVNPFSLLTNTTISTHKNAYKKILDEITLIFNSLKSSYGPMGLDKLCVDNSGDIFISNDGATIIKSMVVDSPISKILTSLAIEQDNAVGDGTTSVVLLAYYLIKEGINLINQDIEPTTVINGYRMAYSEVSKQIKTMCYRVSHSQKLDLIDTAISSKIIYEEKDHFIKIISGVLKSNSKNIHIVKSVGGSMKDTKWSKGFILDCTIASELMRKEYTKNRDYTNDNKDKNNNKDEGCLLFCGNFGLLKEKLPLTVNINSNVDDLDRIREEEINLTKKKCQKIIETGAKLVLLSGGIDEICIKMFVDANVAAVRRVDVADLKLLSNKVHDSPDYLEDACTEIDGFELKQYGEYKLMHVLCDRSTILIRGPTRQICDEIQRSINDAVEVVRSTEMSNDDFILPGGGAVEAQLYKKLRMFGNSLDMREHISIFKYAEALKELVCNLCENAGYSGESVFGELLSEQEMCGVDLSKENYVIQDNVKGGIIEPAKYKLKAIKAATEAAMAILRINEIIEFN